MIISALLKLILFILNVLSNIFGSLIPSFPDGITNVLNDITTIIDSGLSFVSYFVYWPVCTALISITLSYVAFVNVKNIVMKVIGHFFAN